MNCAEIRNRLSEYLDGETAPDMSKMIEGHLAECPECRRRFSELQDLSYAMGTLPTAELPPEFNGELKTKITTIKREHPPTRRLFQRTWVRVTALAAACLVLVIGAVGVLTSGMARMGGSDSANQDITLDYDSGASYDGGDGSSSDKMYSLEVPAADESYGTENSNSGSVTTDDASVSEQEAAAGGEVERKIVQNATLALEVEDFETSFSTIEDLADKYGGFVVSGQQYNSEDDPYQRGYISLRVEAAQLEAALAEIGALGTVDSSAINADDITSDYYDTQSRLTQYEAQRERLLGFYDQATDVADLIALEAELNRVQTEIDYLAGTMKMYDQLTTLAQINIDIYTPSIYTTTVQPQGFAGFWHNVKAAFLDGINAFLNFLAGALVFLVRHLLWFIILAAVIVALVVICRRRRRKVTKHN
jgi:hypothetical protein